MSPGSTDCKKGCVAEMLLFALLAVSCGGSSPAATPTATATLSPTPPPTASVGAGLEAPDPTSLPEATAPGELGRTVLPVNRYRITSNFRGLQWRLNGRQRTPGMDREAPEDITASYGRTQPVGCGIVGLMASNIATGELYPEDWTAENVIAYYTTGPDWEVEDFGREGRLYWVRWNTTCSLAESSAMDDLFMVSWGNEGSPWVFSALGGSPEERDELIAVFVREFR